LNGASDIVSNFIIPIIIGVVSYLVRLRKKQKVTEKATSILENRTDSVDKKIQRLDQTVHVIIEHDPNKEIKEIKETLTAMTRVVQDLQEQKKVSFQQKAELFRMIERHEKIFRTMLHVNKKFQDDLKRIHKMLETHKLIIK
jgi:uncharacterized protein YeeX (DUF496 family)